MSEMEISLSDTLVSKLANFFTLLGTACIGTLTGFFSTGEDS